MRRSSVFDNDFLSRSWDLSVAGSDILLTRPGVATITSASALSCNTAFAKYRRIDSVLRSDAVNALSVSKMKFRAREFKTIDVAVNPVRKVRYVNWYMQTKDVTLDTMPRIRNGRTRLSFKKIRSFDTLMIYLVQLALMRQKQDNLPGRRVACLSKFSLTRPLPPLSHVGFSADWQTSSLVAAVP